jgi:hypothetical protein
MKALAHTSPGGLEQTLGIVAWLFCVVQFGFAVVVAVCRDALGLAGNLVANIGLAVLNVVAALWFAKHAGIGVAGAIGLLYGLMLSLVAVFLAFQKWDALPVSIGLATVSLVIALIFGGMDLANLSHCAHDGAVC